ncbi:RraA family protein [Burkholderia sp. Ac-20379]|uniref:RraA family protein n=1 Tax=Burkholderia sp. Ac-20379 TaxID=2703900 RepID=UPI001F11B6FD|nr:RraA family protein [Burkholderia sp. Ac-20379]
MLKIGARVQGLSLAAALEFEGVPVAALGDCMGRATGTAHLLPRHGPAPMIGNALTVKPRPGDNLMIHKALELAQAGDVLVVDGSGASDSALVGDVILTIARSRRLAGFVVDGAVRDVAAFARAGFPCYSRSVTHRGPSKSGLGEINTTIAVDGMVVHPGDLVIGDADGVLAIRPDDALALLTCARLHIERETALRASIENGTFDLSWVDARIEALQRGT